MEAADVRGLLGVLLSEGSMVHYPTPAGGYVQLTITGGYKASAFLEEKVEEINHFLSTEAQIVPYETRPRENGRTSTVLRFRVSTNRLRPVYNLLYPCGKRQITSTALNMLGGHAAGWVWACGAHNAKDGTSMLSKVGNTEDEAELVSQWLEILTGASSVLDSEMIRPRLFFGKGEAKKIRAALLAYAPRTRRHLFNDEVIDVSILRSARTELLLRQGQDELKGFEQEALAGDSALRT